MPGLAILDGQPGAGKTTLICRLLESNQCRAQQHVCRVFCKPGSGGWGPASGVCIENLEDRRDPGLKKALAQMERKVRGR